MIQLFGHLYAPDDRGLCAVTVDGDSIVAIGPTEAPPAGSLGGPGARILPGLIDIQVNGAFGDDFSDPSADVPSICRRLPRFGVTAFVPTIVTSPPDVYVPALANLRHPPVPGETRVLGVHIEGPFISPTYRGAHDPAHLRLPSIEEASRWLEAGDVRWLTLAPELPGALALISFLVERGVRVSIGHTDATWSEAAAGADAGATLATHLFNAMRPLRHRDPGVAGYVLATGLTAGFIADGNHVAFETLRVVARIKAPDELVLITDALAGLGMPPGRYMVAGHEYVSDGTSGRLLDGTLTGSLLPLNLALRNLVEKVGLEPAVAVRLATLNPARALGLDGTLGRVEVGRVADLAVVDENWQVEATIAGGSIAYLGDGDAAAASQAR
ncbi:MAG: N-acetylglucosamine-6-phosphate deacetylase [Candidatus Limnocylindrales bacterium]|jgi:N-acetylglucosamine-6-phosphate deacetylase